MHLRKHITAFLFFAFVATLATAQTSGEIENVEIEKVKERKLQVPSVTRR